MAQTQLLRALGALPLPLAVVAAATGLGVGLSSRLAAQDSYDLDLARIRAAAASHAQDAEAFARSIAHRGNALRDEAKVVSETARANVVHNPTYRAPSLTASFDFDAMIKTAHAANTPDSAPRLIVFASISMPSDALKRTVDDVGRAGGAVVFRGLPQNSAAAFTTVLSKVLPKGAVQTNIGIDPRLFRAFSVEAVPTYVVSSTAIDLCDGLDCRSAPPPHDQLRGNVTLAFALETMAGGDGPGASAAALFRRRLEAER